MMRFETDLQVVRASPADGEIGLSASRWALAEAATIANISAAVERRTWTVAMSLATVRMTAFCCCLPPVSDSFM